MSPGLVNGVDTTAKPGAELPTSPSAAAFVGLNPADYSISPVTAMRGGEVISSVSTATLDGEVDSPKKIYLELKDGQIYEGVSFGARKSAAGELVFQTGMVGYPESITDPSYRGQILVTTFPLAGNYGVPSREEADEFLGGLAKYFESSDIHVAGLVVAAYCGEQYSHHLAKSSLGTWLKERGIPAMYGVDTRALTKVIREHGSLLARMLHESDNPRPLEPNGHTLANGSLTTLKNWKADVDILDWVDQNTINLVDQGKVGAGSWM